jgi:organic radical activating enzyme
MRSFQNPVSAKDLAKLVESLWNPAIKYLSLTGGEPLLHTEFILELADEFFGPLYLETNAMFSREAQRLKHAVHVAACDVKLPEHRATATYDLLLREELRTIECFHNSQAHAFAKVVVLKETLSETIELVAQRLATIDNNLLLVLQPVTPLFKTLSPDNSQLLRLMDAAAVHLNQVRVIPQMHRLLGIA